MFIAFENKNIIKGNASFFIKIFDHEGFGSQRFLCWDKCPNRKLLKIEEQPDLKKKTAASTTSLIKHTQKKESKSCSQSPYFAAAAAVAVIAIGYLLNGRW